VLVGLEVSRRARQEKTLGPGSRLGPLGPVLDFRPPGALDPESVRADHFAGFAGAVRELGAVDVGRRDRQTQPVSSQECAFHFGFCHA